MILQWEYNTLSIWREDKDVVEGSRQLTIAAQELGKEGWELVTVLHLQGGFQAFFKRSKFSEIYLSVPADSPASGAA